MLLSLWYCGQHKSYALYIPGVGLSLIFHKSDKTMGPSGIEGFQGSKKVLQNDRPIYSPEVHCAWPLTHYSAGDKFWNEHWSKVISQRTAAPRSTAKPPAKFFSSRHISGNLPVCLQGTSVNVRAKSQMNVKNVQTEEHFFFSYCWAVGLQAKVTGCFFSHFISPGMFSPSFYSPHS